MEDGGRRMRRRKRRREEKWGPSDQPVTRNGPWAAGIPSAISPPPLPPLPPILPPPSPCLLYTSDAADDTPC
eukprot:3714970-Pyramimonas_sp.AAC.1